MTIPVWVLLLFAAWALLLLFGTVEFFRWSRILTGRARIVQAGHAARVRPMCAIEGNPEAICSF